MIDPANEALYNNRALVPDHMDTIEWWIRKSEETRASAGGQLNISYGDSRRQIMDIFSPPVTNAPIMIFVHGGYWQGLDPSAFSFIAPRLNDLGYCVAIVGYDLCPDVTVGEITAQVQKACAFLYRHAKDYGADPHHLFVSGHSAGGHLTAEMVATDWTKVEDGLPPDMVKGGLSISGLFDLMPIVTTSINDKAGFDENSARLCSPILRKPVSRGRLILVVGGQESQAFFDQADRLATAWANDLDGIERLDIDGTNHFTVVNQFAEPGSPLIGAAAELLG